MNFGFESLGLEQIVSFTVPANAPSRRVMEKLGMTHDENDDFATIPRCPPATRCVPTSCIGSCARAGATGLDVDSRQSQY